MNQAILHLDADAFFASVIQAAYPEYKGKPIATGKERGVAIAVSYEAKRFGVQRCMTTAQIKQLCPECVIVSSNFRLYHLFSQRMFTILRSFTPYVEEYSIDEGFCDITPLAALHKMTYFEVANKIKNTIENSLGITVSLGVSTTKSLAKVAANVKKPSGCVVVEEKDIFEFLKTIPTIKIWGIGPQISQKLNILGVHTAYDFVAHSEAWVRQNLSKPYIEIWHELRGTPIFDIDTTDKTTYKSISKVQTFFPPVTNKDVLWARLCSRLEDAFGKARDFHYNVGNVTIYLKTQQFTYHSAEIKLKEKTAFPFMIRSIIRKNFENMFHPHTPYRATGCVLTNLEPATSHQESLFYNPRSLEEKMKKIYPLFEQRKVQFASSLFDKHHKKTSLNRLRIPLVNIE